MDAALFFISYRSLEAEFALQVAADLRNSGVKIWMDRLDGNITGGDDWRRALEHGIDACSGMVIALSPGYIGSKYCMRELARADSRQIPIIPLIYRPVKTFPIEIQRLQYIDFQAWPDEDSYRRSFSLLLNRFQSEAASAVGSAPDSEHAYLTSLVARLEARRGVLHYVDLHGDVLEAQEGQLHQRPFPGPIEQWGLDSEFLPLLDAKTSSTNPICRSGIAREILTSASPYSVRRRVMAILGAPGAGKTTLLERLALDAARARLDDPLTTNLPLYLSLSRWGGN